MGVACSLEVHTIIKTTFKEGIETTMVEILSTSKKIFQTTWQEEIDLINKDKREATIIMRRKIPSLSDKTKIENT